MKIRNSKFANPLYALFISLLASSFLALPAFGAAGGSIISWGMQFVDCAEFDQKNHVSINSGWYHSLALKSDGSIVGWGFNSSGLATPPDGNDYIAIAAGG